MRESSYSDHERTSKHIRKHSLEVTSITSVTFLAYRGNSAGAGLTKLSPGV